MQFLLYIAVTALLSTFTLAYMGVFKKLTAQFCKLGPYTVIFKQWQGDVAEIGQQFKQMEKITKRIFKHADSFGIYFDNPHKIIDKNKMRTVIGIIITNMDAEGGKIDRFLKRHKEFQKKELPQVSGFKCSFPYRNLLSFIIGPKRAYQALNQQMQNLESNDMDKFVAAFEIVRPNNRRILDFIFIVDESVSEGQDSKYWLTNLPQPEYRNDSDSEVYDEGEDEEGEDEVEEGEEDGEDGEEEIEESEQEEEEEEEGGIGQNILDNLHTESAEKKKKKK